MCGFDLTIHCVTHCLWFIGFQVAPMQHLMYDEGEYGFRNGAEVLYCNGAGDMEQQGKVLCVFPALHAVRPCAGMPVVRSSCSMCNMVLCRFARLLFGVSLSEITGGMSLTAHRLRSDHHVRSNGPAWSSVGQYCASQARIKHWPKVFWPVASRLLISMFIFFVFFVIFANYLTAMYIKSDV